MRRTADRHPAARTRSNRALIVFVAVFFLMGLGAIAPMGAGLLASAGASEEGTDQTAILDDEYAMKREDDSASDSLVRTSHLRKNRSSPPVTLPMGVGQGPHG